MDLFDALGPEVGKVFASKRAEVTRHLFVTPNAPEELACALVQEITGRRAAVVADKRTAAVAAAPVVESLRASGFSVALHIIDDDDGHPPVCDGRTRDALQSALPPCDVLVGVGSGVISDLVKWVAFERGVPGAIFATAASMNGYSAANVAPAVDGVKTLISARSHLVVATTPAILVTAPRELTTAGLGDVIAKWVSTADWRMNDLLFGEAYCAPIAGIIDHIERTFLARPEALADNDEAAICGLFSALIYSGCAMTLQGSSLPASGGEHLISHALDMRALAHGEAHDLHGRQVGLGTITAAALYHRVLALPAPVFEPVELALDRAGWGSAVDAVAVQHRRKSQRLADAVQRLSQGDTWARLRPMLREMVPTPERVKSVLSLAQAAHRVQDIGVDRERYRWAVLNGAQMRERFTSLDLAWASGVLPSAVDDIITCYLL